jgi:hypothetical protein
LETKKVIDLPVRHSRERGNPATLGADLRTEQRHWGSRWQARGVPPAIGMPIETPAKLRAFAGTTV